MRTAESMKHIALVAAALALSGCMVAQIADAAVDVVTLPVKAAAKGVDLATTSQSEADEKRGREARKADEERGRQAKLLAERCRTGKTRPDDVCPATR